MRIGTGFDSHRLVEGRPLILGGVRIECERGLAGHSDADALSHAVADALLGAASLGDIGVHFPDDDPRCAGMDSLKILAEVAALVRRSGHRLENVDATVICERPRLRPHIEEMRSNLAAALAVEIGAVSVKAKTAEALGAIGRGEGIAAQAVALLRPAE